MTYQALARKWRPGRFGQVVGQEHVVAALSHALDNDRVHHAFLFTGTRGVGKTTLARLLAKSLNCQEGVSASPCGVCGACTSVDEGRFVDLLEVDAASRTRVDDTRELLDNVQYAPTMGRYKVYLIDEVHMLSGHSFNALLKTLEEPPPHVKFLLATTDPQKLPATILSRCLQFNLRALTADEISAQLGRILASESIASEPAALNLLARSANGSMRDALSLLDYSIAFSGADLTEQSIRRMLGMIDENQVVEIIRALIAADAGALFAVVDAMRERSMDFQRALDDILGLLFELALYKQAPEVASRRQNEWGDLSTLAQDIEAETLQLLYQIALIGKRDLPLAPDPARGFEMVLLRMLAFEPQAPSAESAPPPPAAARRAGPGRASDKRQAPGPVSTAPTAASASAPGQGSAEPVPAPEQTPPPASFRPGPGASGNSTAVGTVDAQRWGQLVESSPLRGLVRELAMNLAFNELRGETLVVTLDESIGHLYNKTRHDVLENAVREQLGAAYRIQVDQVRREEKADTPAVQREVRMTKEREQAFEGMRNDPDIRGFIDNFDAEVVADSVQPASHRS